MASLAATLWIFGAPPSEIQRHFLARALHSWAAKHACAYRTEWLVGEETNAYLVSPESSEFGIWRITRPSNADADEKSEDAVVYRGPSMYPGDGVSFLVSLGLLAVERSLEAQGEARVVVAPAFDRFDVIRSEKKEMLLVVALPEQVMEGLGAHLQVTMVIAGFPATVQLISMVGTDLEFSPRKGVRIERFRRVIELDYEPSILGTVIRRDTVDLAGWTEDWEDFTALGTYIYSDFDCSHRIPLPSALSYEFPVPSVIEELEIPEHFLLE